MVRFDPTTPRYCYQLFVYNPQTNFSCCFMHDSSCLSYFLNKETFSQSKNSILIK